MTTPKNDQTLCFSLLNVLLKNLVKLTPPINLNCITIRWKDINENKILRYQSSLEKRTNIHLQEVEDLNG